MGEERRQFRRMPSKLVIQYSVRPSKESHLTTTVDIGGGGICFLVPQPIPRKSYVDCELTLPGGRRPITFTAQVAWCDPPPKAAKSRCRAGLEMIFIEQADQLALTRYCIKLGELKPPPAKG